MRDNSINKSSDSVRHIAAILDEVLATYEETEFDLRLLAADDHRRHEMTKESATVSVA